MVHAIDPPALLGALEAALGQVDAHRRREQRSTQSYCVGPGPKGLTRMVNPAAVTIHSTVKRSFPLSAVKSALAAGF